MPTRTIREGIISSDRVELLDWAGEVFYRRLLNKVDDYGLYDARPSFLRSSLYPLRVDRVREADCSRWIAMCEKAGLIALYDAGGKPFLKVLDTRWQVRSEPKFPLPPENICEQLQSVAPVVVVEVGDEVNTLSGRSRGTDLDGFEILWKAYPKRAGNNPKRRAEKAYRARIAEKHTPAEMLDGAGRYAKFIRATGKEGTEFVMMTSTFLGPDKPFAQPWTDPKAVASRPAEAVKKPCLTERCENDGDIHLGHGLYVCAKCYLPPERGAGSRSMAYPEPLRTAIERARQAKEPA